MCIQQISIFRIDVLLRFIFTIDGYKLPLETNLKANNYLNLVDERLHIISLSSK